MLSKLLEFIVKYLLSIIALIFYFLIWMAVAVNLNKGFDNNFAGGVMVIALYLIVRIVFVIYLLGYILAAYFDKANRKVYLVFLLLLFIPVVFVLLIN